MKPLFVVLSAPSGGGKTTLCDLLLERYPEFCYSVSCTTRRPRVNEEDGVDYHSLPEETFERLVREGQFLEHARVHGHSYGTLKEPVYSAFRENQSVLLHIDVNGAKQIRKHVSALPEGDPLRNSDVDIFILPPSLGALAEWLKKRNTDAPDVIEKRVGEARREMERAGDYMYKVVNDDLDVAYHRLCEIINAKAGLEP